MADHDEVVAAVHHLLRKLNADPELECHRILRILQKLDRLPITVRVLQETGVGKAVNKLRKRGGEITESVKHLVQSWKELVREAMEAEEKIQASPERDPSRSPSPQSESSDEEAEDEASDEEEEEEEDSSSDESSESDREDERHNKHYSAEQSPCYDSPPPSPIRDPRPKPSSNRRMSNDRNDRVSVSEKDRASSKRHHEPSPSRSQESPRTHSSTSSSQIKKRRIEEQSSLDCSESSRIMKKKPLDDDSFSQALFPSPRRVGSSPSSSLNKSPVQKDRGGDKTSSHTKPVKSEHSLSKPSPSRREKGSERSVSKSPQKKIIQKNDQDRTKARKSDAGVFNGSVREAQASFLDKVDDVDDTVSKHKSTGVKVNKTPLQSSSKSSSMSKSSSSSSSVSSSKSSSQKKPKSASLAQSAEKESESSRTTEKSAQREHDRLSSKSSKDRKPVVSSDKLASKSKSHPDNSSVKLTKDPESKPGAKETPAPKVKRKLSSGERRISEEDAQSFQNTGLSFGDILMGPVQSTKVKKPVKRLNTSTTETSKKSSSSSSTMNKPSSKSSSKSTVKSSSSSSSNARRGDSSSSKSVAQKASGSKSSSTSGKGSKKIASKEDKKSRRDELKIPRSLSPKLEDIHQEITYNLPEISADYKPLRLPEFAPKKKVSGLSEEGSYIGSKHARTKLYSGRARQTLSSVPSLFEACMRILCDNIDSLYEVGVPYDIIKPVLEKCKPQQLIRIEDYNPYLIEDTDDLWRIHVEKDFRKCQPSEMESWRELYLRKMDEREYKLKNLTANISASWAKKDPGRLTKLAYVNGPAKPPRNIQRQQARHGTGRITSHPSSNPHKPYVPSKHAGDQGPIRSSSTSTIRSQEPAGSSSSGGGGGGAGGGGGGGGGGGSQNYGNISMSSSNGGSSRGGRAKVIAPMMQKALRMKKMFRR